MKKIYRILAGLGFLGALVSCGGINEIAKFDDKDAFVAFASPRVSVEENAGKVEIPVSIASVSPKKTTVTYKVEDISAKQGTNYTLSDASATLNFEGSDREKMLVINIANLAGKFTGDLQFKVTIEGATGLNVGVGNTCVVTIEDLDHPLSSIFGTYTVSAKTDEGKAESWELIIDKNEKSLTSVKVGNIISAFASQIPYPGVDNSYVANVKFDENKNIVGLTIPVGQGCGGFKYKKEKEVQIGIYLPEKEEGNYASGNINLSYKDGVFTMDEAYIVNVDGVGAFGAYLGGSTWTKK